MKTNGSKNSFGELSLSGLQEDFEDNEEMALSYLESKFDMEVVNDIKNRIRIQLLTDGKDLHSNY